MVAPALAAGRLRRLRSGVRLSEMTLTATFPRAPADHMARHIVALAREVSGQTEYGVDRDITAQRQQGGEKDAPETRL